MKLFRILWYRWKLYRYAMPFDYSAPLWSKRSNGWIYPNGDLVERQS